MFDVHQTIPEDVITVSCSSGRSTTYQWSAVATKKECYLELLQVRRGFCDSQAPACSAMISLKTASVCDRLSPMIDEYAFMVHLAEMNTAQFHQHKLLRPEMSDRCINDSGDAALGH